jgi:hypothetical protein
MSPNAGEGGVQQLYTGAQINFGDLPAHLICPQGFGLTASQTSFVRVRVKVLLIYAFNYLFI